MDYSGTGTRERPIITMETVGGAAFGLKRLLHVKGRGLYRRGGISPYANCRKREHSQTRCMRLESLVDLLIIMGGIFP